MLASVHIVAHKLCALLCRKEDPDPDGKLLASTSDPLGEATKLLDKLKQHAGTRFDPCTHHQPLARKFMSWTSGVLTKWHVVSCFTVAHVEDTAFHLGHSRAVYMYMYKLHVNLCEVP